MTAEVLKPEERLQQHAVSIVTEAKALVVRDQVTLDLADDKLAVIKGLLREADDVFDPVISANHKAHQASIQAKRKVAGPLLEAEAALKRSMADYDQRQKEIEAEANRKAAAEAERMRVEAEAEQRRLAAEAEAKHAAEVEEQIELAEMLGAPAEEIQRLAEQPLPLIAVPQPVFMPAPPPVVSTYRRPARSSFTPKYKVLETVDVLKLARYVVDHPEMQRLLLPNMVALNQMASALKDAMQIPGVMVVRDTVVSQRAR